MGAGGYRSITALTSPRQLVTHPHQVLEHIAEVLSLLKDAETGQRGYIITGEEAFLEPYQGGTSNVHAVVKEIRELTADNPNQQKRIDEAEPLIAAKLAELKQTIDLRRKGNLEETTKVIRGGEGKKTMDNLRVILAEMEREERDLLKQRADEVEAASSGAKSTIIYGTIFCLLFVMAAGVFIIRSLSGQIGAAVRHVQSSSAELQSAANQQA